jgi:hypothetical protein
MLGAPIKEHPMGTPGAISPSDDIPLGPLEPVLTADEAAKRWRELLAAGAPGLDSRDGAPRGAP